MAPARIGLRFLSQSPLARNIAFRQPTLRQTFARRAQSTSAAPVAEASGFQKLWNSPIGPKTVHFWAPIMKWGVVLSGIADFARPVESLSLTQNLALTCTGAIWTRWCFVIRPKNLFLAAVNFFLFTVGATQVTRIVLYNQSLKKDSLTDEIKAAAKEEMGAVEGLVEEAKEAVEGLRKA